MNLDEFRSYAEFGADEQALLRAAWPLVEPETPALVEDFYERILGHESTRSIISDPDQVTRLKRTLVVWMRELFNGPWDAAYVKRRRRIGLVHVDVGVDHAVMFMAMSALQERLIALVEQGMDSAAATARAIRKVTVLDLGLMTGTYHETLKEQMVRDARALLVAHLPAVALLVNADGVVQSSTTAASWLFDVDSRPDSRYHDVLPRELVEGASLPRYIDRALATGNDVKLPRVDAVIRGEPHNLSITIVPFERPEPGAIIYLENHTVAVEAERRLQQAEHLAAIGTMSATIAHELRNPLAGISGALQVIAASLDASDRKREVIGKILEQVRALNRMVTDLLAFARPDKLQKEDGIDLAALCRSVIDNVEEDYPDVAFEVSGEAQAAVDPAMVRQVLLNLGLNACQALNGKGRVAFDVHGEHITVCDSGPGLPEDVKRRIFEPFFTTKLKGTGLGLPISLKVARAMGGDLQLVPAGELGGACFRLWLRRPPSA